MDQEKRLPQKEGGEDVTAEEQVVGEIMLMPEDALEIVLSTTPNLEDLIILTTQLIGYAEELNGEGDEIPEGIMSFFKKNKLPTEKITPENYLLALRFLSEVGQRVLEQKNNLGKEGAIQAVMKRLSEAYGSILGTGERPTKFGATRLAEAAVRVVMNSQRSNNSYDIVHETENGFLKKIEEYIHLCFQDGKLDYRSLYARPDIWIAVEQSEEYIATKRGLEILENSLQDIIAVCASDRKKARIIDFGTGTCTKGERIAYKFIEANKEVKYHGVDSGPVMLKAGTVIMVENFMRLLLDEEKRAKLPKDSSWKSLIDFIEKHNLKHSRNYLLRDVLYRIFYKYINHAWVQKETNLKGAQPDLFKYLAARILALHKKRPNQKALISELDSDEIKSPLTIYPNLSRIEDLSPELFKPSEDESVVAFDLGCRACNQHPEKSTKLYGKLLSDPVINEANDPPSGPEDESKITASYLVAGMQISHFNKNSRNFENEKIKISRGYNSEESVDFVTYPFKFDFVEYRDPETDEVLNFNDLTEQNDISQETVYEEDPDSPDFYRIVHKLVFNKQIKVKVGGHDEIVKNVNDRIVLIVSYKPTLEQMIELYTKNGLNICNIYMDNPKCPKYVKFLLRKMTPGEKAVPVDERIEQLKEKFCPKNKKKNQQKGAEEEVLRNSNGEPSSEVY